RAAILLDVDGTLAPIVTRPELAAVPEETRAELRRLVGRYALVGFVSGRTGMAARELGGGDGAACAGVRRLAAQSGAAASRGPARGPGREAAAGRGRLRPFAAAGGPGVEDKGLTVAFHWREAPDEEAARAELAEVAERARLVGLEPHWGRKVLELRPPVHADK